MFMKCGRPVILNYYRVDEACNDQRSPGTFIEVFS